MLDQPKQRERRQAPRYKVSCRCWIEQEAVTLYGTVTNLSSSGLFLRTLPVVDVGSWVDLKLSLDNGVVIACGEVKWINKPASAGGPGGPPPGLGIRFTELRTGGDILQRFVQRVSLIPEPEQG